MSKACLLSSFKVNSNKTRSLSNISLFPSLPLSLIRLIRSFRVENFGFRSSLSMNARPPEARPVLKNLVAGVQNIDFFGINIDSSIVLIDSAHVA
ncbi:hypothetical protein BpHYR1_027334 [Brachionus plicatilis]|uniref:Uncharacterized protein n=1 Tax=Brachionus plicatilis TaxID=10195 RepID=A0A3M7SY11_BRAPC|nr:hypothetical protein BpHYR1_027334 [Brachionus plicatilis]